MVLRRKDFGCVGLIRRNKGGFRVYGSKKDLGCSGFRGNKGDLGCVGFVGHKGDVGCVGFRGNKGGLGCLGFRGQGLMGFYGRGGGGGGEGVISVFSRVIGIYSRAHRISLPVLLGVALWLSSTLGLVEALSVENLQRSWDRMRRSPGSGRSAGGAVLGELLIRQNGL